MKGMGICYFEDWWAKNILLAGTFTVLGNRVKVASSANIMAPYY